LWISSTYFKEPVTLATRPLDGFFAFEFIIEVLFFRAD